VPPPARIVYLATSGERIGGAEVQYEYLIDDLDRSRYDPLLLTPARGAVNEALERAGVRTLEVVYPAWRRRHLLARRGARERLIGVAREQGAALVHADFNFGPYAIAMAEALAVPCVLHVRGRLKRGWVRRYGLDRATALIAIGRRYRDQLEEYGIAKEGIAIIEDATDLVRFAPRRCDLLRREHPELAGRVLFGIVGRLEPFKRQLDFLRAAGRLHAAGGRAAFVVVGAPNLDWPRYTLRVRALAEALGIAPQVVFTGARADIEQVIASLDVLVTLSGGSVMIEAMACGVPVVSASDRPAADLDIVRDGESGLVVPAGDADALLRAMRRLAGDEALRRSLGASGRLRAEAKFGRRRLARETEQLYEAVLGRPW
jgi:glycosyltransferase involved in cell wall biosynthesis